VNTVPSSGEADAEGEVRTGVICELAVSLLIPMRSGNVCLVVRDLALLP
jgi:hypothetical protein